MTTEDMKNLVRALGYDWRHVGRITFTPDNIEIERLIWDYKKDGPIIDYVTHEFAITTDRLEYQS